ncbi:MAG: replication-relaxation family protein [Eubacterium sp.]|nr:replication-relaxation family protein [Eubacterium sp.]MDE6766638.1 replication-relaxation family protein [Eubacterium sp.]
MSKEGFRFVERDYKILREIDRWRVITGRQIAELTGFTGQRACDRRLQKLIQAKYITRQKYLYGFPSIYSLTNAGKIIIQAPKATQQIRLEQIIHDSYVTDTAIYISRKFDIPFSDITTEKELHRQDGFSNRKHRPDFVYLHNGKTICVEVELTMKAKNRFEKNITSNFENYDGQLWIVPDMKCNIAKVLIEHQDIYPDISIMPLDEVKANE